MSNLNLVLIQVDLEVSLSKFMKIQKRVQKKVEEMGLRKKILGTNLIKKELDKLAKQIRLKVQKHIKCNNIK